MNNATSVPAMRTFSFLGLSNDKEKEKEADRRFLYDFRVIIRDDVILCNKTYCKLIKNHLTKIKL